MLSIYRLSAGLILISIVGACDDSASTAHDAGTSSDAGSLPAAGKSGRGGNGAVAGHSASGGNGAVAGHAGAAVVAGHSAGGGNAAVAGHSANGGNGAVAGQTGDSDAGHAANGGTGGADVYLGPSVGSAKAFAVLAYDSVTTANTSSLLGSIGVSAAAISVITGFDDAGFFKFGSDSLAPNAALTGIAQGDVTTLVGNIDPRACDNDLTDVVGGLTGDVTLHPGVTCMNSFSADVLVDGHVYLDAAGDSNAFFVIRGNKTLTVADGAKVVLMNDAQDCGVFWRISEAVTIGKTVEFHGTIIAGTAITMKTASTLNGRALAQTAGVQLDANTIDAPTDGQCPHMQ
jgi:Ice-binding-like